MIGSSLRLRLLLGAGAWITLALAMAGAAIVFIFASSVKEDQREDLRTSLDRVLTAASADVPIDNIDPLLGDARYATPAGGLYWQVLDLQDGNLAQSRSLWDTLLKVSPPAATGDTLSTMAGPGDQLLTVLSQDVIIQRGQAARTLRVSVAEDSALRGRDIRRFALDIGIALLVLGLSLALAAWLQVHLGLKPLNGLRRAIEEVGTGERQTLGEDYPGEILPLVKEVNALLASHERSITFARARADDLAHGLKTPLAVLGATVGRLRSTGDEANANVLKLLGDEMAERVDYQLRLAQLRVRSSDHALSASLDQALIRSAAVLRKTGGGEALYWKLDIQSAEVDMDAHDLMELVGVLLENAAAWARSEVRIACRLSGDVAEFELQDDGPGMTDAEIASLGQRGKRIDEKRSGTGFGIAIAREILELNRGRLSISRAPEGGLAVLVRIPARTRGAGSA